MKTISETIGGAQALLDIDFDLQSCFEEQLTDAHKTFLQVIRVLEGAQKPLVRPYSGRGRKPLQYAPFMRSLWAKTIFGIDKTSSLISRLKSDPNMRLLCGFKKVPGKASFSRAYSYLSSTTTTEETLDTLVRNTHKGLVVYHVSHDSTAIPAREKRPRKASKKDETTYKKPPKRVYKKTRHILKQHIQQTVEESLAATPQNSAFGCKRSASGIVQFWHGYKLHLDVSDTGFPLSAFVSAANVSDCHAAIILEKMTERKVQFCYSLMDSAYDADAIKEFIESRGRVPIIKTNPRWKHRPPLDPAKQERYKIRTTVERAYSYLKENLIPKNIYVKGYQKVSFVLMSAVLCLAALRTLQFFIL